jgi:hypothetical protein
MSKKKLLSEAQVKRFMGLAGLNPINEMYHSEQNENMYEAEDEEAPVEMGPEEEEKEGGEAEVVMDEEAILRIKTSLDDLQADLAPLLSQAGEEEADLDDEEIEMDTEEEPEVDAEEPAEEPAEDDADMDDELMEVDMEMNEDEIVTEVARRVAKRIVEAKRAHKKMNEALGRKK